MTGRKVHVKVIRVIVVELSASLMTCSIEQFRYIGVLHLQ